MSLTRLDRLLSERGYCTRREVRDRLRKGDLPLLVAGQPARQPEQKVRAEDVTWDGQPLDPPQLYLLVHKPAGLTCSHEDRGDIIYDLLPPRYMARHPQPATVGRLDKDTTGLILITDDGQALHRLTSPRHKVPKIYDVDIAHPLSEEDAALIRSGGLLLEGEEKPLLPSDLEIPQPTKLQLTLYEGRYHQIKRTLIALGNEVTKLHRSHFGPLGLGELQEGQMRFLTPEEIANLLP